MRNVGQCLSYCSRIKAVLPFSNPFELIFPKHIYHARRLPENFQQCFFVPHNLAPPTFSPRVPIQNLYLTKTVFVIILNHTISFRTSELMQLTLISHFSDLLLNLLSVSFFLIIKSHLIYCVCIFPSQGVYKMSWGQTLGLTLLLL